jgi:hypothetical protein
MKESKQIHFVAKLELNSWSTKSLKVSKIRVEETSETETKFKAIVPILLVNA